ncbi:carbohydrate ABC transporter permease [Kitasatospora purpeofusca]|uniref:carbohydrate ABC transporter permease n=1 Tax=Kitasatospora purpeofusca TaxID=67352 RepID=UPI0036B361B4
MAATTGPAFRASRRGQVLLTAVMLALLAFTVAPLYWLAIASTHTAHDIFGRPPQLLPGGELGTNLGHLEESVGFGRVVLNSLMLSVTYTVLGGIVCTLAGYGFAKFRFRGQGLMFSVLLLALVVPTQLTVVPLFRMMVNLDWLNTYQAVLLPNLALPFGIFLMRQSMSALPDELLQAGRIDGCGELRLFLRIALPTMRPALAALAMFLFLFQWNDFLWPLIALRDPASYTVPVALAALTGSSDVDYGQLLTGTAVAAVPMAVLFLFLQKHFVSGMLAGAVKQ